ncbi:hypothetical protein HHK36_000887 [Tetracentron sinense]|uniref:PGG domain-containing protein n=1 Tax=Tetracentron sinense TaxID=13715 RepID=A0A834ZWN6_TETSI|nr:hypothetical protein HHK36_000887 [Tetracentron sinense]
MDQSLIDAAREGNIDSLYELLHENPFVLENVDRVPFIDTPLHIAISAGKTSFAKEIANLKPSFAKKLNQDGFSPIHLASKMGDNGMMKELLKIGNELCLPKGREKRTPLHCAAMFGCIDIIHELVHNFPKSIVDLTVQKETALHLALKNKQPEAFRVLLDWVEDLDKRYIVNWKDNEGNTTIKNLLSIYDFNFLLRVILWVRCYVAPKFLELNIPKVEVNAVNAYHQTALDILLLRQSKYENLEMKEIQDILCRAKAVRGYDIITTPPVHTSSYHSQDLHNIPKPLRGWILQFGLEVVRDCQMEVRNALLVVAVLIATTTFQIGVNPPGGVWQDNSTKDNSTTITATMFDQPHTAGQAIMATNMWGWSFFTICNLTGFLISYAMIIFLTHGLPFRRVILVALQSMAITYMISLIIICPLNEDSVFLVFPLIGLGVIVLSLLYMGAILFHYSQSRNWRGLNAEIFRTKRLEHQDELQAIFTGTLATGDLQWAPAVGTRPQNLENASYSYTEQPTDDTLGDDEYVRSTHVPKDCGLEELVVGDNEQPGPQRRSEPSVGLRRPRNASRGASIDSQM